MMKLEPKEYGEFLKKPTFYLASILGSIILFLIYFFLTLFFAPKSDVSYEELIEQRFEHNQDPQIDVNYSAQETKIPDDYWELFITSDQKREYEIALQDLRETIQKKELELSQVHKVIISYIPNILKTFIQQNTWAKEIEYILSQKYFQSKNLHFLLEFHRKKDVSRGKYYRKKISLYDVVSLPKHELVWVFLHELGHYFDIVYFSSKAGFDRSDDFYKISWQAANVIKKWMNTTDFVSGYAMTNKYEDFAETFLYYMLYNQDFQSKTHSSTVLQQKYDFFSSRLFINNEFQNINFRTDDKIKTYYWDITKIPYSLDLLLQYLENWLY